MERRHQETRQARLDRAKTEIAERLVRVCAAMDSREFDELVNRIAQVHLKYTLRRTQEWQRELE